MSQRVGRLPARLSGSNVGLAGKAPPLGRARQPPAQSARLRSPPGATWPPAQAYRFVAYVSRISSTGAGRGTNQGMPKPNPSLTDQELQSAAQRPARLVHQDDHGGRKRPSRREPFARGSGERLSTSSCSSTTPRIPLLERAGPLHPQQGPRGSRGLCGHGDERLLSRKSS
jgi:hypothetical protein